MGSSPTWESARLKRGAFNYLYKKALEARTVSLYTAVKYQALFTVLNKCKNNNKQH